MEQNKRKDTFLDKRYKKPSKMKSWIVELKNVLADKSIIYLTDKQLVFEVNQKLEKDNQISQITFENWKRGQYHPNEEIGAEFINCITRAMIDSKQNLFDRMLSEPAGSWQKIAWIIERRFSEWNLKSISENTNKNEQSMTIQISAGNDEQAALINSIINTDFEEVKPLQLATKKNSKNNEKEDEYDF